MNTSRIQNLRAELSPDDVMLKYRFLVVFKDGTEEVLTGVTPDSWKIEGDFLACESHDGDQIHYFLAANVVRFMTYFI